MIKYLTVISLLVVGCGSDGKDGAPGQDGEHGTQGQPGERGLTGAQGVPGKPGVDGINGKDGVDGQDGESFQEALNREISAVQLSSVVDIECNTGRGTGTYTTEGLLTATHVLKGATGCAVYVPGQPSPLHTWIPTLSATTDVVLQTMTLPLPAVAIDRAWEPVRGAGFLMPNLPYDMWDDMNLSFGRVLSAELTKDFIKRQGGVLFPGAFAVDVVGFSGSSGSPLFVGGKVVAVFVAMYTNGNDVRFAEDL